MVYIEIQTHIFEHGFKLHLTIFLTPRYFFYITIELLTTINPRVTSVIQTSYWFPADAP